VFLDYKFNFLAKYMSNSEVFLLESILNSKFTIMMIKAIQIFAPKVLLNFGEAAK